MTEPVRVAIVGAGGWGQQHVRIFGGRDDTELVAIVGRDAERTRARAHAAGVPGFTDIDAMLDAAQPDLVSVCLPNEGHFAPTLRLLKAGAPLLVEKPLVFDLDEADQLLAVAADRDLFFAINFNHRYAEPIRRATLAASEGLLGELVFASWRFGGEPNFGIHPHAQLIETQCHAFDTLEHICGPIASVMAQMTNKTHGPFTTVAIALEFGNGAVGSLLGSYDSSYAYPLTHHLEINGTEGRAFVEDTVRRLTISRTGDETATVWQAGYFNDDDRDFHRTFDRHVDALLPAFRNGEPPPIHASAGRRALFLAHACIRSFKTGTRVRTDEEDGRADAART
ncbi:MAG: Gfo/Idh/MocA family oxidoreductase [Actinomycetota bacterium]|nr:Gfo/Idh/MocA family oxidoreductase [Actinomycetota bacterium]